MRPAPWLRRAQFKVALYLYGGLAVLATACAVVLLFIWYQVELSRPLLSTKPKPTILSETLGWPWADFPPVMPVERETIQREFRLDEPLVAADLRLWNVLPSSPLLRPYDDIAVSELKAALDAIRALPAPGEKALGGVGGSEGGAKPYDQAIRLLTRANNAQPTRWVVLYDRGILNFRKGSYRAAERDLEAALSTLQPMLDNPSGVETYEAAIHTYYALGHAISRVGQGEPESQQVERRTQVVGSFRIARHLLRPLFDLRDPSYASVSNALEFFPLRPTRVSTAAIAGDQVAAYLSAPGYHDCEERPNKSDPCATLDRLAPCYYRDRVFCNSLKRSGGAFTRPFTELFHRFYGGDASAWGDENHLWALSNTMDFMAENADIGDDPYLLYNLGSLLIQVGEPEAAAGLLGRAVDDLGGAVLPSKDIDRIIRLSAVASVLAGNPPRGGRAALDRTPSLLRQVYKRLYGYEGENAPYNLRPFAPVGVAFQSDAEALLDRWLFLRLWQAMLAEGDFEGYLREYKRVMAEPEVPHDFFRRWHDETLAILGDRALKRADDLKAEPERAAEIRTFVSDQGDFPLEVESRARGGAGGWVLWAARRSAVPAIGFAFGLVLFWAVIWAIGLVRGYRETFFSAHRRRRKGSLDAAYPGDL